MYRRVEPPEDTNQLRIERDKTTTRLNEEYIMKTTSPEQKPATPEERAQEYLQKAYRLQMSGHLQEAIENYKASIELHPTAEAHTFLGWAYSFLGEYDTAIEECKVAIGIDPEFGNPYNDI